MTQQIMNTSMTTTAKGLQVLKDIVPMFFGRCRSFAVNMMNVKVIFASAVLAGVIVTLQSGFSVSAKAVVVFCFLGVLLQAILIGRKPLVNFANLCFALAFWATMLRAGLVDKILTALRAVKHGAFRSCALIQTHLAERLNVLLAAVLRLASFTDPLGAAGGGVAATANGTVLGGVWHKSLLGRFFRILT
jgi:hypothetical protein